MSALPSRTDISGTPSNAVAKTALSALYDWVAQRWAPGTSGVAAASASELQATRDAMGLGSSGLRNLVINGGFTINQRGYISGATLAVGAYAHDRWKAGAGGGNYTFTQLNSNTTVTVAAGKTLIQVVEDKMVAGSAYILSWSGTAQCRYATNGVVPSSAYAASPIVFIGQIAGSTMSIEFGNGASSCTLGNVQIEAGSIPTAFDFRPPGLELALAQRYFCKTFLPSTVPANNAGNPGAMAYMSQVAGTAAGGGATWAFPVQMRAVPTVVLYNPSAGGGGVWYNASSAVDSGLPVQSGVTNSASFITNPQVAADAIGRLMCLHATASAEL